MDFDGQFARTSTLAEHQHTVRVTECRCHVNDTFEQLAATWGKKGKAKYAAHKAKSRNAGREE